MAICKIMDCLENNVFDCSGATPEAVESNVRLFLPGPSSVVEPNNVVLLLSFIDRLPRYVVQTDIPFPQSHSTGLYSNLFD